MMKYFFLLSVKVLLLFTVSAQSKDAFVNNAANEIRNNSQLERFAHELTDGIGPRLVGSPQVKKANDWLISSYAKMGIKAVNEQYGTWKSWDRGITHVDMITPRVKTLEAIQLAWSPSTKGKTLTGSTIILPLSIQDSASLAKFLPALTGKFVLISANPATGIPRQTWDTFSVKGDYERIARINELNDDSANARIARIGRNTFYNMLDKSGALGVLSMYWSGGYGVNRIFSAYTNVIPSIDISLEDYGMLYRLTQSANTPKLSVKTDSKDLGRAPVYNTIATIPGTAKKDEYIILSAHIDTWDGASGATDNATGTVLMMEAMRLLKKFYPNPKRTIIAGHWNSEEQGLNGSRAFVEDHPELIKNIQAVFNQDNGTGRIINISGQGFKDAEKYWNRWLAAVPDSIRQYINTNFPGIPGGGGSDHASFVEVGAPAFMLGSLNWNYFTYTWHTNRDTYDKIVFDELKRNALTIAILAYMASEDNEKTLHEFGELPLHPTTGKPYPLPIQRKAKRSEEEY